MSVRFRATCAHLFFYYEFLNSRSVTRPTARVRPTPADETATRTFAEAAVELVRRSTGSFGPDNAVTVRAKGRCYVSVRKLHAENRPVVPIAERHRRKETNRTFAVDYAVMEVGAGTTEKRRAGRTARRRPLIPVVVNSAKTIFSSLGSDLRRGKRFVIFRIWRESERGVGGGKEVYFEKLIARVPSVTLGRTATVFVGGTRLKKTKSAFADRWNLSKKIPTARDSRVPPGESRSAVAKKLSVVPVDGNLLNLFQPTQSVYFTTSR